jgi:photosystem II stability/assembly factor-like uncharacterized protein
MNDSLTVLRAADPVRRVDFQVLESTPVFHELLDAIVSGQFVADQAVTTTPKSHHRRGRSGSVHSKRRSVAALVSVAAALVVVAAFLTTGLGTGPQGAHSALPEGSRVTPWHAARPLPVTFHVPSSSQTSENWQLVSLVANAGWNVDTSGPPPAWLSCATVTACYALAVRYTSPKAGAQPQSVSLYVSSDLGTTWSVLPMPAGFLPTSALSCSSAQVCGGGGTSDGHPAFAVTIDGGHQWGVVPMAGSLVLRDVTCPTSLLCLGVAGPTGLDMPSQANSILRTTDGGTSWTPSPVPVSGTLLSLSCPSDHACVAIGYSGSHPGITPSGFVLKSSDGGHTWLTGSLPHGFGFAPVLSAISCATASHCMAIGAVNIPNPSQCEGTPPHVVPPPGFDSCDTSQTAEVSAVISSSDGGSTWQSMSLPSDVPLPQLYSLSCASATACWASGQESVPQVIGNVHDAGSPVLLGTSDGGATWSKETFTIPSDAPNYLGQAYLGIGDLSCPGRSACLALGGGAQSAPSTPIYRYENAGSS